MSYHIGIKYAEDVVKGKIISCKYIKQACQRFLDDLDKENWRWKFDIKRANHVIAFVENAICHTKGELAGQPLKLEPWQIFCLINIYGWVDDDDIRRFNYNLLEVARKNGKSLFASGLAIYELIFGEEGGEIYSLATTRDQAKICWDGTARMIEKADPKIRNRFKITTGAIVEEQNWSKFVPLSRDVKKTGDGTNPSFNIFDEASQYEDRNTIEVQTSGTGARKNFAHLFITTASFSKATVYFENRTYLQKILRGDIEDDRWFGVLYTLDDEDDWMDPDVWIKANPNLGVSLKSDYLQNEVNQAKELKSKRNGVLVKHFNIFTNTSESWIDTEHWIKSEQETLSRTGEMYIGLDYGATSDLAAITRLWVNGDHYESDFKCFLPYDSLDTVPPHLMPLYRQAIEDGTLVLTETKTTDYEILEEYIKKSVKEYDFKALAYDPWRASPLTQKLETEGLRMLEVRQSAAYLSPASRETERLIREGLIKHTRDPFITWQLENCEAYTDPVRENLTIRKGDDKNLKIDSIVAMIMTISLAAGKLEDEKVFNITFI